MAQYLPRTPHPNFLDMRRAYGTKISLGLCSYFFVCTIGCRLLGRFLQIKNCQDPLIFPISFGVAFGNCIGGSDTPAIWDRSRTSELDSRVCGGYEVDIFLLCSPSPRYLFVIGTFQDAMQTTECAKPLPKCHFVC